MDAEELKAGVYPSLNESPSEKEGKYPGKFRGLCDGQASMKALPKRKGNARPVAILGPRDSASMKALPKRKGNRVSESRNMGIVSGLNESPSEKEGKSRVNQRKHIRVLRRLNESPSEKEGKFSRQHDHRRARSHASMKALPKRKGNMRCTFCSCCANDSPQ